MEKTSHGTEWKVGLFLFISILLGASLAVYFGKLGTGLEKHYEITVEFENADRLLGGADVYLSGAKAGFVSKAPKLIQGRYAVQVGLKIKDTIKLPKKCDIVVNSAGLMGDVSISINPRKDASPDDAIEPGAYIVGSRQEGLTDLGAKAGDVMEEVKRTLEKMNRDLLSDENVKSVKATFENLKVTTENFKKATTDLDSLVAKGKDAMTSAKDAMDTAKTAVGKLDSALAKADTAFGKIDGAVDGMKATFASISKFSDNAGKTMDSVRLLINKANAGGGALGMLLADKETAANLKALVRNLKERGILFYKDKPKD